MYALETSIFRAEKERRERGERGRELGPLTVSVRECVGRSVGGSQEGRKEGEVRICVRAGRVGYLAHWLDPFHV